MDIGEPISCIVPGCKRDRAPKFLGWHGNKMITSAYCEDHGPQTRITTCGECGSVKSSRWVCGPTESRQLAYAMAKSARSRWLARRGNICPEWHDVAAFIAWIEANIGPRPEGRTLDRVNNDGHYEPGNVRWATRSEQRRNRRLA